MDFRNSISQSPRSAQKVLEGSEDDRACRICFEVSSTSNPIISPCKCSGTMKYIHEECLKTWILSQNTDFKQVKCDVCKSEIEIDIRVRTIFSLKNFEKECIKIIVFPFVICLISVIFGIVVIYLASGIYKDSLSVSEKVYLTFVVVSCIIMLTSLIYTFIRAIKQGCCAKKMISWRVICNKEACAQGESNENKITELCKDGCNDTVIHRDSFDEARNLNVLNSPTNVFKKVEESENSGFSLRIISGDHIIISELGEVSEANNRMPHEAA